MLVERAVLQTPISFVVVVGFDGVRAFKPAIEASFGRKLDEDLD
jgi:hypothetical protein